MGVIPEDIRKAAEDLAEKIEDNGMWGDYSDWGIKPEGTAMIAAALMAERERCAKIADKIAAEYIGDAPHDEWDSGAINTAETIRDIIRSGG